MVKHYTSHSTPRGPAAAGTIGSPDGRRNAIWNAGLSLAAAGVALVCGVGLMIPAFDTGTVVAHVGFVSAEISSSGESGLRVGLRGRECMPGQARCPFLAVDYDASDLQLL